LAVDKPRKNDEILLKMHKSLTNPTLLRPLMAFACAAAILAAAGHAGAAVYVPASDAQVLERLPFKPNDPVARDIARLRGQLQRDPRQLDIAVQLARRYYEMVGEEGDPRYLGYAQAALAPWWNMPQPPVEVQVLRASLGQFRHDFDSANSDLNQVLEREPRHVRARVLRAVLAIVQARYAAARADCVALRGLTSELLAVGCEATIDGLTGKAAAAYATLNAALERTPGASRDEKMWVLLRLAELAQRQGKTAQVESHLRQAMALGVVDTFLYAAYTDFLLDQGRAAEVVALLKDHTRSDSLLLRLVLATRALNLPQAKQHEAALAARYAAAAMRGDTVHQAEEARFALAVQGDAKRSLKLGLENWKVQLEPRDARVVLEAAVALKDAPAAAPVLKWLTQNHNEDRTLNMLAAQLNGGQR
jgi:hypothetical protein